MVFGNHDESYIPAISSEKKVRIKHIEELPYSSSSYGPQDIGGVGNYELALQAPSDGSWGAAGADVLRMYFLDTFKDGNVKDTLMSYFKSLAAAHKTKAPALMFFHIPLAEYNEFTGQGQGEKNEKVSATKSNGLLQAMVDMGDVKAAFVGHDHKNNFCFLKTPIHLCYGGGVGYGAAYGDKTIPRMAGVIEWFKSPDVESIVTWQYKQNTVNTYDKYTIYNQVRS
ncbi:purple acid phosphatase [Aphanomyces cochlioides]|nr:purple acid phosphatase [Aphanomyces cochlioides]